MSKLRKAKVASIEQAFEKIAAHVRQHASVKENKNSSDDLWFRSDYGNEIKVTPDDIDTVSHTGECYDDAVKLANNPRIRVQLDNLDPESLRKELAEYGAWSQDELNDHEENLIRWLWIGCNNLDEERESCTESTDNDSEYRYPETYLHVQELSSGQEWIMPISDRQNLDITTRVKQWVKKEYHGELALDGKVTPRIDGDYYAKILTDGRPPDSAVVWAGAGFYLKPTYS